MQNKIHITIILPVVLYVYKTWSLLLRKEHRLRVYENRVLRILSEPKQDEVAGGWKKQHNGKLYNLYFSSNNIRKIKSRTRQAIPSMVQMIYVLN
jgi:hypothetical protein